MNIIEIIAVLFSLASVILTIKNNIWCWPVGIIGIIFYFILFYENSFFGNMYLQCIFTLQSLIGWYNWNKPSKYPIKWTGRPTQVIIVSISLLLGLLISIISRESGGKMPYFDGVTTSLSIIATLLMSYRKIDCWIIWMAVDVIFIIFFLYSGLYLSSIIYFVFFILSIFGLFKWRRSIKVD